MNLINKGRNIIDLKRKQLESDSYFLDYIKDEIALSENLHKSRSVKYSQNPEDFILIPFKHDFFQMNIMNILAIRCHYLKK